MTVEAVVDSVATEVRAVPVVEIAADSVETVADSVAEVVAVSAPPVAKCSTRFAPNAARKPRFPSSPAVRVPFIAGIVSRPTARHVAVAAAAVVVLATVVVAATAVPAVTERPTFL